MSLSEKQKIQRIKKGNLISYLIIYHSLEIQEIYERPEKEKKNNEDDEKDEKVKKNEKDEKEKKFKKEQKDENDKIYKNNYINEVKYPDSEALEYIEIFIDKSKLDIYKTKETGTDIVPNILKFTLILNKNFPKENPRLLAKTKFSEPSLVDGRDLFNEVCPNWNWAKNSKLIDVTLNINNFCEKVINSSEYKFYGEFYIGAIYQIKNFEAMSLKTFDCKIDKVDGDLLKTSKKYVVVLSDDAFILLQYIDKKCNNAKIVFWSSIFAISNLKIKKMKKKVTLKFFNENNFEINFVLIMDKYISFRQSLFDKMKNVNIERAKVENSGKLLQMCEISKMGISVIEKKIKDYQEFIQIKKEDDYARKIFRLLIKKAINIFASIETPENKTKRDKYNNLLINFV